MDWGISAEGVGGSWVRAGSRVYTLAAECGEKGRLRGGKVYTGGWCVGAHPAEDMPTQAWAWHPKTRPKSRGPRRPDRCVAAGGGGMSRLLRIGDVIETPGVGRCVVFYKCFHDIAGRMDAFGMSLTRPSRLTFGMWARHEVDRDLGLAADACRIKALQAVTYRDRTKKKRGWKLWQEDRERWSRQARRIDRLIERLRIREAV